MSFCPDVGKLRWRRNAPDGQARRHKFAPWYWQGQSALVEKRKRKKNANRMEQHKERGARFAITKQKTVVN